MNDEWIIRDVIPDDIAFIYASWSNCIKRTELGNCARPSLFFKGFMSLMDDIITHDTTKILVACLPKEQTVILGFIVCQPDIVHFIFVKRPFQNLGIGTSLYHTADKPKRYSMRSPSLNVLENKLKNLTYHPFLPHLTFKQGDINGEGSNHEHECETKSTS